MKDNTHQFRVAGMGTVVGATMVGALLVVTCSPGKLPCDKDEQWMAVCAEPGGGVGGAGGGGGSDGGSPDMGVSTLTAETEVANCADFNTVGKMDQLFTTRCGTATACHGDGTPWQDLKQAGIWDRYTDGMNDTAKFFCVGSKLIDTEKWDDSFIWKKVNMPVACPPTGTGMTGNIMPDQTMAALKQDLLNATELACLESYLKVIAEKK